MKYYAIDMGNGIEDYNPFANFDDAFEKACEIVESDFIENYERGMSQFYRGHQDFSIVEMENDEDDNPIEISRVNCWADFGSSGIYKEKTCKAS